MILDFYADPGHGWVKVPRRLVNTLGIQNQISRCSYQKGNHVYLEEDCDATLLVQSLKAQNVQVTFREHVSNRSSKIRSYDRYVDMDGEGS